MGIISFIWLVGGRVVMGVPPGAQTRPMPASQCSNSLENTSSLADGGTPVVAGGSEG